MKANTQNFEYPNFCFAYSYIGIEVFFRKNPYAYSSDIKIQYDTFIEEDS